MSAAPLLLVNPAAAGGRGAARLRGLAEPAGVKSVVTRSAADLTERARHAAGEGRDRVIVAGGDGTVHHAVRALAGTDCALGLVPTGSGNDLARVMGLEFDPARALAAAVSGRPQRVDVGYVDGRPFAGVVGLGFAGEVNQYANERTGWPQGRWTYPYAVLRTLRKFEPPLLRVKHDQGTWEGEAILIALANSPCFGGGMRIAPEARMDDGRLDMVIVKRVPKLKLLGLFPRVYRGSHILHPAVLSFRVRAVELSASRALTFFADGEALAPVSSEGSKIEIRPRALSVIV
jgi:diacylglycerol kinase (ATP)